VITLRTPSDKRASPTPSVRAIRLDPEALDVVPGPLAPDPVAILTCCPGSELFNVVEERLHGRHALVLAA
jgi:hypothetical protein